MKAITTLVYEGYCIATIQIDTENPEQVKQKEIIIKTLKEKFDECKATYTFVVEEPSYQVTLK